MARPDKISRFLPISFANGTRIRHFGKHCPRCKTMVGAEDMHGLANLVQDKIFLAAHASCPKCNSRFSIGCVITDDKHVHRVMLPNWVFYIWLRVALRNAPQPAMQENWALDEAEESTPTGVIVSQSNLVTRSEEILGRFQGEPICAWIEYEGQRFIFERAVPSLEQLSLAESELLFEGKLIYRQN